MKNKIYSLGIIAIGAMIVAGFAGCASTPRELDQARLAEFENASWVATPLAGQILPLGGFRLGQFNPIRREQIEYFANISVTQAFDDGKWYALTAPEFPGNYFFKWDLQRDGSRRLIGEINTVNADTLTAMIAYTDAFYNATWVRRVLPNEPSLTGLNQLNALDRELQIFNVRDIGPLESGKWLETTAVEMPGVIFLTFRPEGIVTVARIYKRVTP